DPTLGTAEQGKDQTRGHRRSPRGPTSGRPGAGRGGRTNPTRQGPSRGGARGLRHPTGTRGGDPSTVRRTHGASTRPPGPLTELLGARPAEPALLRHRSEERRGGKD